MYNLYSLSNTSIEHMYHMDHVYNTIMHLINGNKLGLDLAFLIIGKLAYSLSLNVIGIECNIVNNNNVQLSLFVYNAFSKGCISKMMIIYNTDLQKVYSSKSDYEFLPKNWDDLLD